MNGRTVFCFVEGVKLGGGGGWKFKFLLRDEITTIKMSASDFFCTTNTE